MKHYALPLAAASLATSMLWAGSAYSADEVIRLPPPSDLASSSEVPKAGEHKNPLGIPDTSTVRALAAPAGLIPGSSGAPAGVSAPQAFGSFGIPYTETRVQAGSTNLTSANSGFAFLASTYPYRAIGKLLFVTPDGESECTASVIRRGIIVTAAHCIEDFAGGASIFTNYRFIPGHDGRAGATLTQQRPYGLWTGRAIIRPATWANGTDRGCDSARDNDLAIIALNKNNNQLIGQVVGQLNYGWNSTQFVKSAKTGNISTAATTTLGYPALLDEGLILQRADGPSYLVNITCADGAALNIWQGSNFTPGSSGGPWIVNFASALPALSGGAAPGAQATANTVIGVTSWGSPDPNVIKDNYSSRFGQNPEYPLAAYDTPSRGAGNIAALLTILCNSAAGAPFAGSYEANGWCD